jgi:crotonobetaine/carnitine-CoA ligase
MIVHPKLVERLAGISLGRIERIIVDDPATPTGIDGVTVENADALKDNALQDAALGPDHLAPSDRPRLWDPQMVIFTSGTTGPSKGVVASYHHLWTTGKATYGYMTAEDCMLINLPMFHVGGTASMMAAVACGGSVALYDGFTSQEFWSQIKTHKATTISGLIGAMTAFLARTPPRPADTENTLRMCTLAPLNAETFALARRFGFSYVSGFNMTELSGPLITAVDDRTPASCGRPRSGVVCRVVDDHDIEVAVGQIGELVVRSDRPWDQASGYLGDPAASIAAWRNGWFHSGDLVRKDEHGNFYFVDRKKDAIRRRGENISSLEVEADVAAHPSIGEVAAYGVESADGEQEVMIAVSPRVGATIDPTALIDFLQPRMAHFMVPRYIRVEKSLPKTGTNKIQKSELRAEGIVSGTWDRESAGRKLKREKL